MRFNFHVITVITIIVNLLTGLVYFADANITKEEMFQALNEVSIKLMESFGAFAGKQQESFDNSTKKLQESFDNLTKKLQESFDNSTKKLQESFDDFEIKQKNIFDAFAIEQQNSFNQLNKVVKDGFTSAHNFGRDRVNILKKSSMELRLQGYGCVGVGTRHAFFIDGNVGQFFTPHFNCSDGVMPMNLSESVITHPNYDLGIILGCPELNFVLNMSTYTKPMLGDSVIAYGFGDTAKAWTGSIADVGFAHKDLHSRPHIHWNGYPNANHINSDEVYVQSFQHSGQSGGPVSNGCGYVGMSHAVVVSNDKFAHFCSLIPPKRMIEFVKEHQSKLKRLEDCHDLEVLNLPMMPFMDCDIRSFHTDHDQIGVCSGENKCSTDI